MKLASGTAPVVGYRAAGVNVGLGTDGAASNNDLDMFEAMRQAAFQQKLVNMDPRVISAPEALELATIGGARVLGQQARIGSLESGKRADIIVVNMDRARQTPMFDPVSQVVYVTRGDDVDTTIVNGKVLMRGRKVLTLNESRVLADARTGGRSRAKGGRAVAPTRVLPACRSRSLRCQAIRGRRCTAGCGIARRSRGRSRRRTGLRW